MLLSQDDVNQLLRTKHHQERQLLYKDEFVSHKLLGDLHAVAYDVLHHQFPNSASKRMLNNRNILEKAELRRIFQEMYVILLDRQASEIIDL